MLGPGRYLLGVAELALLVGFAWLGAASVRARLLPRLAGVPAQLATAVMALALLIWVAELLGTVGWFKPVPYLVGVVVAGWGLASGFAGAGAGMGWPPLDFGRLRTETTDWLTSFALVVASSPWSISPVGCRRGCRRA